MPIEFTMPRLLPLFLISCSAITASAVEQPHFASGIKIGEVTQDSAIVWVRLTRNKSADFDRLKIFKEGLPSNARVKIDMPADVVPGMPGKVRVRYDEAGESTLLETDWVSVDSDTDFIHQFRLKNLTPGSAYSIIVDAKSTSGEESTITGRFRTAPEKSHTAPIRFIVTTCQAVRSIDSAADGHKAYGFMEKFDPHFFVHTGDILYYDKVPLCKNVAQARAKWNLMFAYGHNRRFHRNFTAYFMKDDHDTLKNDCWPGQKYGDLTFDQGLSIFREQVPMGELTYRTVRWGKHVQIWMTENRDYRSSNRDPDGPEKTILGATQKAWLKKTLDESDATHKFVISPGPLVGPDKRGKKDNHSNDVFAHEGQELRDFLSGMKNTYVICGDRHWQYCSQDPKTKLLELGCGPINDEHNFGGNPGNNPKFHRYFGSRGGFLGITVVDGEARADWFSANEPPTANGTARVLHTEQLGSRRN